MPLQRIVFHICGFDPKYDFNDDVIAHGVACWIELATHDHEG